MEKVTISQLKNQLSAFLRKVRAGKTIIVFDRNEPVARIERIRGELHPDERLSSLVKAGLVRRASHRVPIKTLQEKPPSAKKSVVQALLEERRAGR
jgi:antitoxin (DNA-binding transcriptional repressor) of toxin-antitoxin stability system